MVWTSENTAKLLSLNNVGFICNGIAIERFSESRIRLLFNYYNHFIFSSEVELLAEELRNDTDGRIAVIIDSDHLSQGIIDLEFNPYRMPSIDSFSDSIIKTYEFIESCRTL